MSLATRLMFVLLSVLLSASLSANTVYKNYDIPLLDNRFRIDHGVEQISFMLHRKEARTPAILVRPDGSKIYASRLPENVRWLESGSMDIVTISKPVPGPWQAIAENRGRNAVRIFSDIALNVDPLPKQVYDGERIKLTARLTDAGKHVQFDEMIRDSILHVNLFESIMVNGEERFLRHSQGTFADDGKHFDERADDGHYTVELNFDGEVGKFDFVASTLNGVLSRAHRQEILIYPHPVELSISSPTYDDPLAYLKLNIDTDEIKTDSVIVTGKVFDNVGWEEPFEVRMETSTYTISLPTPELEGRYRVTLDIFAETNLGRELVLVPPELDFVVLPPPPPPPEPEAVDAAPEPEPTPLWQVILVGVLIAAVIAGIALVVMRWLKGRAKPKEEESVEEQG